ncbi:MAG TPA: glycosyltransferase family 39 protein [Rugosimonospora sp.]|nr:glycosyltransferase family 39 protein [Rugosimonospora sp.]
MPSTEEPAATGPGRSGPGRHWSTTVPATGLGALLLGLVVFVLTQARVYGRTYDELMQDDYGKSTLAWYLSLGHDRSFLQFPSYEQVPQHGPFADTIIAIGERFTGEQWTTRSIMAGLFAVLGVLAIALCGYELGGWWMALLSAIGLALYPRYFGAMFNNSKDLPLAGAMALVLWLVLRLMRRWDDPGWVRRSVLVGVALGAATAIRVVALLWFVPLLVLAAGWWWRRRRRAARPPWRPALRRQVLAGLLIGGTTWVTTAALWPYVLLSPVSNLIDSIRSNARYPWDVPIPFNGQMVPATHLPAWYVPEWLVIGSPLHIVVLGAVGIGVTGYPLLRRRVLDARYGLVLLTVAVPVALLAGLHSTVYNGLRHFMFTVPGLVLLAALALVRLVQARREVTIAAIGLALFGQAEAAISMARLHPYEYVYFSPVVGGFAGAVGRYELDYWGECDKAAAEWLAAHADQLGMSPDRPVTVAANAIETEWLQYLPHDRFTEADPGAAPDVYIWSMRERDADRWPTYRTVHEIRIEDYPACIVQVTTRLPRR